MALTTLQTLAAQAVSAPVLRLPAASGMARAYLVLHTPRIASGSAEMDSGEPDAVHEFIAELLELGGMAVIA